MKDFLNGIKTGLGAIAFVAVFVGLMVVCELLDQATEFGGKRVWDTCKLSEVARGELKAPIEAEAIRQCTDDGQFTAAECASISLSFGCPQDRGVL